MGQMSTAFTIVPRSKEAGKHDILGTLQPTRFISEHRDGLSFLQIQVPCNCDLGLKSCVPHFIIAISDILKL